MEGVSIINCFLSDNIWRDKVALSIIEVEMPKSIKMGIERVSIVI